MNKYKMMAMCSFSIVCILVLSLFLPLATVANDKESIEMRMHYEKSTVTTDIIVNSDDYSGVVCKYLEVDNVLLVDNLMEETKQNGATLNLSETSEGNYTTTIENVSKRYVVIYASTGNCELCDYIDCKISLGDDTETETPKQEENNTETETPKQEENNTETETPKQEENNTETETPKQEENNTETETPKQEENNTETETPKQEENNTETETPKQEENNTQVEAPKQEVQQAQNTKQENNTQNSVSNNNLAVLAAKDDSNNSTPAIQDDGDFQEIQSVDKVTSTADTKMPQTGENDSIKIAGIAIFSVISVVSFYKYKKEK